MRTTRRVTLMAEQPPRRIDQAIVQALAERGEPVTRSALARAFAEGLVCVDGKPVRASQRVDAPTLVEVTLVAAPPLSAEPEALPLSILYEDEHLLVVDKPAGMVVHASLGHARGTLVNAVLYHLQEKADALPILPGGDPTRPGIVHRLDRDTSGALVIAKHARAQEGLAATFRTHDLVREYVGVLAGTTSWQTQHVQTGHARDPADRRRIAPRHGAKRQAISDFSVCERLHEATACTIALKTGRTHQIRMHARHLGHPILGDALYGFGRTPRDERVRAAVATLGRHALHAMVLQLRHPIEDRILRVQAPLPADLSALLASLRQAV